jgi:TP901 family phage tail tape measure protein
MSIVDRLVAVLGYKIEGEDQLRKFNKGLDDTEASARRSSEKVKKLGVAAGAVATGALALGVAGLKNYAAFERQLTRIGVTAGASVQETADAGQSLQKLANDFALPIDEAVKGLDTLVSSGLSLKDAMDFMPAVLTTAQGAGAATEDIANTALKVSSALKIETKDMQHAFDIMVAGGKAGQFELKDMAQYIPDLANSFAQMGYKGEDGLKRLIAILQTLREDTGSASSAATNAQNVFFKMFSQETEKNFKGFGVNIREEMAKAQKSGEDAISAYLRLTQEVLTKNPTAKLGDLFADQQFQLGMQSLLTSGESLKKFFDVLNSSDVDGSAFRDAKRVIDDTDGSLQRLSNSWDQFMKTVGGKVAPTATSVLDTLTGGINQAPAMNTQLEKEGLSWVERRLWMAKNGFNTDLQSEKARLGGWQGGTDEERNVAKQAPDAWRVLGRFPQRPISTPAAPAQATSLIPQTAATGLSRLAGGIGEMKPSQDLSALAAALDGANAHLAEMASRAAVDPVITDARQDNRQFPVSVNAPVTVQVQQASQAPAAAGAAVGRAVGQAAVEQATRIEAEPTY